ncbi:LLM class flavin-dependent oxidoreductase [Streptomyces sp. NBC_00199]|uniref:LLM class flavin-dependent oxidoreductase n=1 Tax=Streptomyces sp. NBC_00199 TaxID=2975678 RepID=UPI00224FE380|nr:LLM class flavin-dependent oxidoreductase [Streptomyces sp. NBC_00199]MCX5264276.1 LLM class flavin-dependent oxidoreductase [Streptomyces sp. NBC_00199]
MVTPLARRRPAKVARETATLDRLGGGRLTLGVGLGSDRFAGEWSATGEELDDRRRGRMLDESLEILTAAWSGAPVHHRGPHYTVDGVSFLPRPVQRPGVPVWAAGFPGNVRPLRRAARHDGFFPVNLERPDQLADAVAALAALREGGRARTTSPSPSRPGPIRRPTPPPAPPGGWRSSRRRRCRWTRCAECSATARPTPAGRAPSDRGRGSRGPAHDVLRAPFRHLPDGRRGSRATTGSRPVVQVARLRRRLRHRARPAGSSSAWHAPCVWLTCGNSLCSSRWGLPARETVHNIMVTGANRLSSVACPGRRPESGPSTDSGAVQCMKSASWCWRRRRVAHSARRGPTPTLSQRAGDSPTGAR